MPVPVTPSRFQRYVAVLSRWLFVFGMVFVLAKLAGDYITNHILPQYYRATVRMEVSPRLQNQGTGFDQIGFQDDVIIIESADVLSPIIYDLGLKTAWAKRVFKKEEGLTDQEALTYMNKILKVEKVPKTNFVKITVTDDDAKEAADIANAIADRYKKMRDVEETQRDNRGMDALKEQIATQQKVVDDAKAEVEKEREKLAIPGVDMPGGPMPLNELEELREHELDKRKGGLLVAQEDYDARKVLLDKIINLPDDQFVAALKGTGRDPNIAFDPDKPSQYRDQVAALRRAMQVDTYMAKSRVDLLRTQVDELTAEVRKIASGQLRPFLDAQRQLKQQQSLLDALKIRLKQDQADIAFQQSPVRIVSRAEVPTKPDHRIAPTLTIIGAGILGLIAASFVEMILLFQRAAERHGN